MNKKEEKEPSDFTVSIIAFVIILSGLIFNLIVMIMNPFNEIFISCLIFELIYGIIFTLSLISILKGRRKNKNE